MAANYNDLPDNLPVPQDDGAAAHLQGTSLPSVSLQATNQTVVDLSSLKGTVVVYCYPRTGEPGKPLPPRWDDIPGARGCTPQSCAFRDRFANFPANTHIFGSSTQDTPYQKELADRLHLPYLLLSDDHLELTRALRLPTFDVEGMTLVKRLTMIIRKGVIVKVFYPVFPPNQNASDVLAWLKANPT
ncbi:hypothetical protein BZG36_01847 [Bifiguratus adelaidae]|uniref:Thioredoxin domain-containing protein n=1 Tax=Bifiguratus adelaidae TaxID=1938954 RepID=A0A261Y2I0_9FUNG|nr:hypothetical protein BZG36_01847 [Bifiguratus adelaidae]